MLKRLGRLDEAENDLLLARKLATRPDDIGDIDYNLAAVYALQGKVGDALRLIRTLRGTRFMAAIRAHAGDYFSRLQDDPEFIEVLQR